MARRPKTTKPSAGQKLVSFNPEASPFKPRPPVGKESVVAVDTNLTTSYGCSAAPTALARKLNINSTAEITLTIPRECEIDLLTFKYTPSL